MQSWLYTTYHIIVPLSVISTRRPWECRTSCKGKRQWSSSWVIVTHNNAHMQTMTTSYKRKDNETLSGWHSKNAHMQTLCLEEECNMSISGTSALPSFVSDCTGTSSLVLLTWVRRWSWGATCSCGGLNPCTGESRNLFSSGFWLTEIKPTVQMQHIIEDAC